MKNYKIEMLRKIIDNLNFIFKNSEKVELNIKKK